MMDSFVLGCVLVVDEDPDWLDPLEREVLKPICDNMTIEDCS